VEWKLLTIPGRPYPHSRRNSTHRKEGKGDRIINWGMDASSTAESRGVHGGQPEGRVEQRGRSTILREWLKTA